MGKHMLTGIKGCVGESRIFRVDPRMIRVVAGRNPRSYFDDGGMEDLKKSIIKNGVKVPIVIKKNKDGHLELIDGERRTRACMAAIKEGADIKSVPAMVERPTITDAEMLRASLVCNDGMPLSPVDEGRAYKRLMDWGHGQAEIGDMVGRSNVHIINRLKLVDTAPVVEDAVNKGQIPISKAVDIVDKSNGDTAEQQKQLDLAPKKGKRAKRVLIKWAEKKNEYRIQYEEREDKKEQLLALVNNPKGPWRKFEKQLSDLGYDYGSIKLRVEPYKVQDD